MNSKILGIGLGVAVTALCSLPLTVHAAQGDILVRGGIGYVVPKDDNLKNVLGPGTGTDVQVDEGLSLTVEAVYMFADRWGVELLAAWPFSHDVKVDGVGRVATVEHLPPTLSLQYYFATEGQFRPYVGVGLNYTTFTKEKEKGALRDGFRLELDDSWGAAFQVGLDVDMGDNWFGNLGLRYIDIESDLSLNGDKLGTVKIDPWVYQLQIGYRFSRTPAAPAPVAQPAPAPAPEPAPVAVVVDSDGDGVPDDRDLCPDTPRGDRVDVHGCSCEITRRVQFAFASAELTPAGRAVLDELAAELQRLTFIRGTIVGHTDSVGSEAYNQALSERRARSVVQYLESKGVDRGRLTSRGAGESEPIADNSTDEGRALNRRVTLTRTDC